MTTIEQEVGPTIGQVQTDTFCEGCGYNLHTQAVLRDERLGIPVCRCPECGRYTAAGQTTTASHVWLNRLGTILLAVWVSFLIGIFLLGALFFGLLARGHVAAMTELHFENIHTVAGPMSSHSYTPHYVIRNVSADRVAEHRWAQILLATLTVTLGLITGGLFSTFLWHCKGLTRLVALTPPLLGCAVVAMQWNSDAWASAIRGWGLTQIGFYLLLELGAVAIGLFIGRPVARGLLRILVPPKARQHLAFLWLTDGKVLKPA